MDASIVMAKQKVLHQMWAKNDRNLCKIKQLRQEIENDQVKTANIEAIKRAEIQRYEFEKERSTLNNTVELNRLMFV